MKNNVDIARLNQEFDEFINEVKSSISLKAEIFQENLKREYQEEHYPPCDNRIIKLIEECMEEQQFWIIGEAFNKAVRLVQTYGNPYHNYRYSFWNTLEDSMAKDLFEYDAHNQE